MIYYSKGKSDEKSEIHRGWVVLKGGEIDVEEDTDTIIAAVGSEVCTHPDVFDGRLRATLMDASGNFYIGEMMEKL